MNLLSLLTNHTHYWGVPHERPTDERLIQTCYGCSADRELKVELRPSRIAMQPQRVPHKTRFVIPLNETISSSQVRAARKENSL